MYLPQEVGESGAPRVTDPPIGDAAGLHWPGPLSPCGRVAGVGTSHGRSLLDGVCVSAATTAKHDCSEFPKPSVICSVSHALRGWAGNFEGSS